MKNIPFINDSAALHLTLADWEALNFSHVAVDALNYCLRKSLSIPEKVTTLFFYTDIRSCHKVSGLKNGVFNLYSPLDGTKIHITPNDLKTLEQALQNQFPDKKVISNVEGISEQAGKDAENGIVYTSDEVSQKIDICDLHWANISEPIDKNCGCYTCQNFTLAYLHHLREVGVPLGVRLCIYHNLYFSHRIL